MAERNLVVGRRTNPVKKQLAKEFRRKMTTEEQVLWQRLRGNRLSDLHFRRQHVIEGFIVDLYCHAIRLVVELDGAVHDEQHERDAERDRVLSLRGLRVLRFANDQVRGDLAGVLRAILAAAAIPAVQDTERA